MKETFPIESSIVFLKKSAAKMNTSVPDEVFTYIAKHIGYHQRRLEGTMIRVVSYATIIGKPITMDFVKGVLDRADKAISLHSD